MSLCRGTHAWLPGHAGIARNSIPELTHSELQTEMMKQKLSEIFSN